MKPDKYKLTQYKNRFKEKVKPMKKDPIFGEFFCSECGTSMNKNEFMNDGGICVECMIYKQKELENDILSLDEE